MKQKFAQGVIDDLCKSYNVPKIEVRSVKDLPMAHAEFDSDSYTILYDSDNAKPWDLVHEFVHYVNHLLYLWDTLEEVVTELTVKGFKRDLVTTHPELYKRLTR